MCALLHRCIGCHRDQADLAVTLGSNHNNAFAELLLQLITEITQSVHVNTCDACSKKFHALHFLYLIHNIAKCILGRFTLK